MSSAKKDTSWQAVAEWYADYSAAEGTYHQTVIVPNLLRRIEPKAGQTILDLACGAGVMSAELTKAGAKIIGIDASATLITAAKKAAPQATFHVASADKIPLAERSVDTAICVLAIQNIAPIRETFVAVARVLKPVGKLYLVLNHPAFRIPKSSSWGWDETTKTQYRRVDAYLSEKSVGITAHPGQKNSETTLSFHRPLQLYVKLLASAGFAITRLEEWISPKKSQAGPRQKEEDRIRKEIPLFMLIEAKLL